MRRLDGRDRSHHQMLGRQRETGSSAVHSRHLTAPQRASGNTNMGTMNTMHQHIAARDTPSHQTQTLGVAEDSRARRDLRLVVARPERFEREARKTTMTSLHGIPRDDSSLHQTGQKIEAKSLDGREIPCRTGPCLEAHGGSARRKNRTRASPGSPRGINPKLSPTYMCILIAKEIIRERLCLLTRMFDLKETRENGPNPRFKRPLSLQPSELEHPSRYLTRRPPRNSSMDIPVYSLLSKQIDVSSTTCTFTLEGQIETASFRIVPSSRTWPPSQRSETSICALWTKPVVAGHTT